MERGELDDQMLALGKDIKLELARTNVTELFMIVLVLVYVGCLAVTAWVAFLEFPDLSFHWVTFDPERLTVVVSAASNHKPHPEICVGENKDVGVN